MRTRNKNRRIWNSLSDAFCAIHLNAPNVSFRNSLQCPIYIINSDKIKLSRNTPTEVASQFLREHTPFVHLRPNIISYPIFFIVTEMWVTTAWSWKGWARNYLQSVLCSREDLRRIGERYAGGLALHAELQLTTLYRAIENWLPLNCQWGRIIGVLRKLMGESGK